MYIFSNPRLTDTKIDIICKLYVGKIIWIHFILIKILYDKRTKNKRKTASNLPSFFE